LGLEQNLVGITTFCDHPASVQGKATVGGPANPSLEAILALRPDLVVMDEEGFGPRLAGRLERLGIKTALFNGTRLSGLSNSIRRLARDLGVPGEGERLAVHIQSSLRPVSTHRKRRRVLFIIWPDPLITAGSGTIIDDALRLAGFDNIAAGADGHYPTLSLEAIIARKPDLIVVGQGHTLGPPLRKLLLRLGSLEAVRRQCICHVGDALYRSGPRIPEGIDELRRCGAQFFPVAIRSLKRHGSQSDQLGID
ncbi:MAG: helical backbone metal receptor, partial [Geobacteraceae bacterium]|nr:helical backbone metal receptor [Geobacteraceae bacterium]